MAPDGIEAQTERALQNLAAVLQAAGASMGDLVKVTIFYTNVDDFTTLNEVYTRHMPDPPPARSAPANVKLPHGLLVSIDAIAVIPERSASCSLSGSRQTTCSEGSRFSSQTKGPTAQHVGFHHVLGSIAVCRT